MSAWTRSEIAYVGGLEVEVERLRGALQQVVDATDFCESAPDLCDSCRIAREALALNRLDSPQDGA